MQRPSVASVCVCLLLLGGTVAAAQPVRLARLYQGRNRGAESVETFSRKVRIARDGRVSLANVSGDVVVTATGGDEVSIDATKRARGGRDLLDRVRIDVDERAGRVDIRTDYGSFWRGGDVAVDYTVTVPAGVALEVHSVSGSIHVSGVKGVVRLSTVSGNIVAKDTPALEYLRTVSGDMDANGVSSDGAVSLSTVSGAIRLDGVKAREVETSTVSGDAVLRDASCGRVSAKSVTGRFEYDGELTRNGRYDVNSHSGGVRFVLTDKIGFELNASSFSGSIRSDFPMTVGGANNRGARYRGRGARGESLEAAFGDGSASLQVRTFSGSIVLTRR